MSGARRERPARDVLLAAAPLLVWALHFFGAYVLVALLCCRDGAPALRPLLAAASAAALLAIAALAWRSRTLADPALRATGGGGGVLALVGVAWTTLPLLWLPACDCG